MSIMPEYSIPTSSDDLSEAQNNFGLTLQAGVSYALHPKFEILSGLTYELNQVNMIEHSLSIICDFDSEGIYRGLKTVAKFHYLGLPLHAKFNFSKEGKGVFAKLGYNQFFKVGGSNTTTWLEECNNQNILIIVEKEPRNLSGEIEIGLGIEIKSAGHTALTLEAVGGYAINGAFKEHRIYKNIRVWDVGMRIGVMFGG